MTMRKAFLLFLSIFVILNLFQDPHSKNQMLKLVQHDVEAQDISSEHIQNFATSIKINKDGTIDVKETIVYDFDGLSRHGIYRDIPYVKTNKEGKKLMMDFSDISVTDETGDSYQFSRIWEDQTLRLKIGDPDRTITGIHTYVISYRVAGALTYFSDHDELYWNVTGDDWPVPISLSTSQVDMGFPIGRTETKATCYAGAFESTDQNCKVSQESNNFFTFKADSSFQSGEGMTIVVSFPKGKVAVLEPKPFVEFWDTLFGKIIFALLFLATILWYIVYPIWIPIKWLRQGRDPKPIGTGETKAWFEPPKSTSGRALTPAEVGGLVDEKADMSDISALIVSLAQRGYLKIVEEKGKGILDRGNKFSLVKQRELAGDTGLLPYERDFFNGLFSEGGAVSLKSRKTYLYSAVENAKKGLYEQLVSSGFFTHSPERARTFYSVIGVIALTTFNIPLAFSAFLFGRHMPKKTVEGAEAAAVAKSLRNFLTSQERQLQFQAKNQMMFEKLLPFAIAFGVEKIWAERFKDLRMQPPEWYEGYSGTRFSSIYFASSLNSSFSSFQSAATTPTSSSSGFSSGFSGGSSGGGGGGGGGGSW